MSRHVPEKGFGGGLVKVVFLGLVVLTAVAYCTGRFGVPG